MFMNFDLSEEVCPGTVIAMASIVPRGVATTMRFLYMGIGGQSRPGTPQGLFPHPSRSLTSRSHFLKPTRLISSFRTSSHSRASSNSCFSWLSVMELPWLPFPRAKLLINTWHPLHVTHPTISISLSLYLGDIRIPE